MIDTFIQFIEQIVIPLGAFGVFFAEIVEEIIVPIPSALVLLTSGFILINGEFSLSIIKDLFFVITLPGALGLTIGSTVVYAFGFYGGKPFLEKYGNFFGVSWQEVLKFDEKMNNSKYDELVFLFARVIPLVPSSLIAIFSGITRMPLKKYLLLTFAGSVIKAFTLGFIGYKVGTLYHKYAEKIAQMENLGLVISLIIIVLFISYRMYIKRRNSFPQ